MIVFPFLKNGDGTAVAIMNYYEALIEDGWNVDFLSLREIQCEWDSMVKNNGGKVYALPAKNKYSIEVKRALKKVLRENKYDIVHVNMPGHIGAMALKFAKKNGCKGRIFHCHNPKNTINFKTKFSTVFYDYFCKKYANYYAACSETAGISRFGDRELTVLKNVIDIERFSYNEEKRFQIRNELGINNRCVIGVAGRFAKQKNPDFIIDCFKEVHKRNSNAFLLWIGEGELLDYVADRLQKENLQGNYCLPGRKNNIEDWYSAMDLFFLPSVFEGMGIVFLEAQSVGVPCIGSKNVPRETEVTELMNRIDLATEMDVWVDRILEILSGQYERKDRKIEFIDAGYTHEQTSKDMLRLYQDIIE